MIKCCIRLWVLDWTSIQPFILKLMISLKGPFRLLRICLGCIIDIDERQLSEPKNRCRELQRSFHYSAEIEDNFQPAEELCRPSKKRCDILGRRLGVPENVSNEMSGDILIRREKLVPRYIGPFEIRSRISEVAYRLVLPPELSQIHLVFHMSMLRKCIANPSHVL